MRKFAKKIYPRLEIKLGTGKKKLSWKKVGMCYELQYRANQYISFFPSFLDTHKSKGLTFQIKLQISSPPFIFSFFLLILFFWSKYTFYILIPSKEIETFFRRFFWGKTQYLYLFSLEKYYIIGRTLLRVRDLKMQQNVLSIVIIILRKQLNIIKFL